MSKTYTIEATHQDDIFDLELKKIHIAFRELGINNFPSEYIDIPTTNKSFSDIQSFSTGLSNTWHKRNKSDENLKHLKDALVKAIKNKKV